MDEWTRKHHEAYKALPALSEEESRRLDIIRNSQRTPQQDTPPGWTEPDPAHPGLVGEARARMEAQRRKMLADLLRADAVTKEVY
jgi:hypothetical protein